MNPITYTLIPTQKKSDEYYSTIHRFTDELLVYAQTGALKFAASYRDYIIQYELEEPRTIEEYLFELLDLGILWRVYGGAALATHYAPYRLLSFLAEFRKTHQRLKSSVDILRAGLMGLFLKTYNQSSPATRYPSVGNIEQLIGWLDATGDFREDALRFIRWHAYFIHQPSCKAESVLQEAVHLAEWFSVASETALGIFTPNVDQFLIQQSSSYRWREDRVACLRTRTEYHLNMVGAEIMNRAFRSSFLPTDRKAVLVPGCMRIRTEQTCQAVQRNEGLCCTGCEPACRVNQLRAMGKKNNFDVYLLPHASDLSRWASKPGAPTIGVVGVACLTTLVGGGWELKRLGVPAQCVLLDYCGCKKHWDDNGVTTELNIQEMKRVFRISTAAPSQAMVPSLIE